ncbi:MAG: DUF3887 domain-containing protein [Dokdonella sp.]
MSIRLFSCALAFGFATAYAAPQQTPTPSNPAATAADIDVDAMARAKDVGGKDATAPVVDGAAVDAGAEVSTQTDTDGSAPAASSTQSAAGAASETPASAAEASDPAQVPLSPIAPIPAASGAEQRLAAGCEERAKSLLDAAQKGDYATATRDFDAKMRAGLPPAKFKQAWESLAQFGALSARGQSHPATSNGYIAVTIPLIFEKANLYAQIACGSDGRIAGFYVKPLDVPAK